MAADWSPQPPATLLLTGPQVELLAGWEAPQVAVAGETRPLPPLLGQAEAGLVMVGARPLSPSRSPGPTLQPLPSPDPRPARPG